MPAAYTDGTDRFGITHLDLVDRSPSGLGVLTRTPIDTGMTVTISPDGKAAPWLKSVVVSCRRIGDRYRIGLRFERLAAA